MKSITRKQRGSGDRRRVSGSTKLPKGQKWAKFLRNDENKTELFEYLSLKIKAMTSEGKLIYSTHSNDVLTAHDSSLLDKLQLAPCSHEEADTRYNSNTRLCQLTGLLNVRCQISGGICIEKFAQ